MFKGILQRLRRWARRDWRRLLQLRDRFEFSEEAFHLVMAAVVGVVGGFVNLVFFYGIESAKWLFYHKIDDPVNVVEEMDWVMRLVTPCWAVWQQAWCCTGAGGFLKSEVQQICWKWL
jgi:hypothetical protein